jgi:hypothetical protein
MEQRPLRLGDIVDDYCPRERRITNHVIVAIVDDAIRQTRCSTCDTEHVFKEARVPRRRSKHDDAAGAVAGQLVSRAAEATPPPVAVMAAAEPVKPAPAPVPAPAAAPPAPVAAVAAQPAEPPAAETRADDAWPAHRQLIRASLPRVEGDQKEPRPIPEFTMHQRHGRGHGYRSHFFGNGNGNGNGNGEVNGNHRGNGNGNGGGFRHGQPGGQGQGGQPGGGGKRWRRRRRGRKPS